MTTFEVLTLLFTFGMFLLTLLSFIVVLINDKKKK